MQTDSPSTTPAPTSAAAAAPVDQPDVKPTGLATAKRLPENPMTRHPVQLINEMRGPVNYNLAEQRGNPPNCVFVYECTLEGVSYSGEGRNKKDAKKECAKAVAKGLYGIVYPN